LRLHLHLVSDSTGETVTTVARAALAQFDGVVPVEHVWFFVRTSAQVERVTSMVAALPGPVIYTLVSAELREILDARCRELAVPCVSVLDGVTGALAQVVGRSGTPRIGHQHAMDDGYFRRIEAMDFALAHDDGQHADGLEQADVVLVGVSRTSKSPTCVYLANRGIKAANVPIGPDLPEVADFASLRSPLVIGLTINPDQLVHIRRSRQRALGLDPMAGDGRYGGDYAEAERVRAEVLHGRRLFARHGWPVIDVTRRSVEETAAAILQMLQARVDPALEQIRDALPGGD
jgi:[pyruvate, water dikinase]-phosphate phosphotransferase / [pyruvate, water dikinase] kinase